MVDGEKEFWAKITKFHNSGMAKDLSIHGKSLLQLKLFRVRQNRGLAFLM